MQFQMLKPDILICTLSSDMFHLNIINVITQNGRPVYSYTCSVHDELMDSNDEKLT